MSPLATILVVVTLAPGAERTQMLEVESLPVCAALAARHNERPDTRAYCQQIDAALWWRLRSSRR